jgi:hypothetical protein
MDPGTEILKEHSKRNILRIARWVGSNRRRFGQVMDLFLHGDELITQRSAWLVSCCAEKHPQLIAPWLREMLKRMQTPGLHDAVKRNVIRTLQFIDIPKDLQGTVATACFDYLSDVTAPVAVKAFSMTVLANIARHEADLKNELRLVIQQMMPFGTAAIQARAKQVLKDLEPRRNGGRHQTRSTGARLSD